MSISVWIATVVVNGGRERWATKTVHGSRRHATARLGEFVEDAGYTRLRVGTVADLLDRWMTLATPAWSSTTLAPTRSIVEHHLKPAAGRSQGQQADHHRHRRPDVLVLADQVIIAQADNRDAGTAWCLTPDHSRGLTRFRSGNMPGHGRFKECRGDSSHVHELRLRL